MHVVGTAGHVDHGKSALVERLTGIDPDRFAEEKRRGLTIDLGFAWLTLPSGREIGVIDVPGHERFIKNMLAGAGGISVCLFVVAANEGWMPQSAEHLAILDVLGISDGVVAVTKSDTVDHETLEIAVGEVEEHLRGTSLEHAAIVPCSAVTGHGLDDLLVALDKAVADAHPVASGTRARLWVDRVFTIAGAGTVVTGTLTGAALAAGDEIEVAPRRRRARIRTIQTHRKEVARMEPGNRVALNLAGLERHGAQRGDAVVEPGRWRSTSTVDATVRVLPAAVTGSDRALTTKGAHLLYVGSAETPVRIKPVTSDRIAPGSSGYARLYLRDPLPLGRGDRFVLRDAGRVLTLGGGIVLDPLPSGAGRRDAERSALLARLVEASNEEALRALVEAEGAISIADALLRSGATSVGSGVTRIGDLLLSEARLAALRDAVRKRLAGHHRDRPLETGMAREALRTALGLGPNEFDDLLGTIPDVAQEGPVVRLESHTVTLAPEQQQMRARVVAALERAGFCPPSAADLDADASLLDALTRSGELVRIADFYLTRRKAAEARRLVRAHIEVHGPATVAQVRDLLGTSRRYAVPLCEWLDATGATRRHGDLRTLGPNP